MVTLYYMVCALAPLVLGVVAAVMGVLLSYVVDARARRPQDAPADDGWALALDAELAPPTPRQGGMLGVRPPWVRHADWVGACYPVFPRARRGRRGGTRPQRRAYGGSSPVPVTPKSSPGTESSGLDPPLPPGVVLGNHTEKNFQDPGRI